MSEPQKVVLYVDDNGREVLTDPEPYEEANARAKDMAQCGVKVLSVVDPDYGRQRITPPRDTRVWYRKQGAEEGQDDMFSGLMTYQEAAASGEGLRSKAYEIVGLISQQQFLERTENAVEELFEGGAVHDPTAPLLHALERVEKTITRQEQARATVPDRNSESRRYQALELALRLLDVKKDTLSPAERKGEGVAKRVVEDARVIEKYLKGTTPRPPKSA
jgi:hypothetical protein